LSFIIAAIRDGLIKAIPMREDDMIASFVNVSSGPSHNNNNDDNKDNNDRNNNACTLKRALLKRGDNSNQDTFDTMSQQVNTLHTHAATLEQDNKAHYDKAGKVLRILSEFAMYKNANKLPDQPLKPFIVVCTSRRCKAGGSLHDSRAINSNHATRFIS